ncbi:MAG: pilus assembly protein PilM, partial [Planctomycetota bacterium]
PTFRDNATTFAVCYGLCLQGLGLSQIHASLIPQEILTQRMIRAKKPWTVAGLGVLMLGLSTNFYFVQNSYRKSHDDIWGKAHQEVSLMSGYSQDHLDEDDKLNKNLTFLNAIGEEIAGEAEDRVVWMELMRAVNQMIPRGKYENGEVPTIKEMPYEDRIDFHITSIDTKRYEDITEWYEPRKERFEEEDLDWRAKMGVTPSEDEDAVAEEDTGPTEEAWVVELQGYHYFNNEDRVGLDGNNHIRRYLVTAFRDPSLLPKDVANRIIRLPDPSDPETVYEYTPAELGISYPLLLNLGTVVEEKIPNPDYDATKAGNAGAMGFGGPGGMPGAAGNNNDEEDVEPQFIPAKRMDFVFQFVWKPTNHAARMEARKQKLEEEGADSGDAAAGPDESVASNPTP